MSLYVQTNVSSLNSQRRLNSATKSLDTTYQRLSSGLRINSAKDDAAGLRFLIDLPTRLTVYSKVTVTQTTVLHYARLWKVL